MTDKKFYQNDKLLVRRTMHCIYVTVAKCIRPAPCFSHMTLRSMLTSNYATDVQPFQLSIGFLIKSISFTFTDILPLDFFFLSATFDMFLCSIDCGLLLLLISVMPYFLALF